MIDSPALFAFIDQLRAAGVRSFKGALYGSPVEIELGPATVVDQEPAKGMTAPDADLCNCKCPRHAHTNGLCLYGCSAEACAGPEAT